MSAPHVSPPHPHPLPTRRSSDLAARFSLPATTSASAKSCAARWAAASPSSNPSSTSSPTRYASPTSTGARFGRRSEEHTSELQSHVKLVCRLLLEKKNVASRGAG